MGKNIYEKQRKNPALVYCTGCGAPVEFDIIHQNYHCASCGANMAIDMPLQEQRAWRQAKQKEFLKHMDAMNLVVYVCPGCGAKVAVETKEALATCSFCGTQLVRREFLTSDVFPEMVIPFYITLKEAENFLKKWCEENKAKKEAVLVKKHLKELIGFYLPYQLVKGPIDCLVTRDNTDRVYHCGGYVDEIAVNTSKQLDNLVLDGMEPFDWGAVQNFDFAYLAGQRVKLQDIKVDELNKRVDKEVQKNYLPVVEKVMEIKGVEIETDGDKLLVLPVLLPAYILQVDKFTAVVNGQTGRVGISALDIEKNRPYLWEPTIITVVAGVGLYAFTQYWGDEVQAMSFELTGMGTVIMGIIAFAVFTDRRKAKITRNVFTGQGQKLSRHLDKLVTEKFAERIPMLPVFFETLKDKKEPVKISFYSVKRFITWGIASLILISLPLLLGYVFRGFNVQHMAYYGAVPWLVLVGAALPMFYMRFGRVLVYDYPILKKIKEDGTLENIPEKEYSTFSLGRVVKTVFTGDYKQFTLVMLGFLLLSSLVVAMGD